MNTTDEPEIDEPDPLNDGSRKLDQRAVIRLLFKEPAIRNYVFAAFGSLAMIFMILFAQGSDIGGLLVVVIGVCGVLLRWTASPALVLLIITYFMWTPFGIPGDGYSSVFTIEARRFSFSDVLIVMSVLVYMASQFRIYGLVYQAVAFDGAAKRKDEPPTRRPASLINPSELMVMIALSGVLVIAGQLIWLFVSGLQVAPGEDFPLRVARTRTSEMYQSDQSGLLSHGASRFYLLVGLLFFGTLAARVIFGYWRLRTIGADEGGMILLDTGWKESHRERVRLEKWRIWGRKRAETQAKQPEKKPRSKP